MRLSSLSYLAEIPREQLAETIHSQDYSAFSRSGDYKPYEYGKVILPFTVLRRLDCVLSPTKQQVLERFAQLARPRSLIRSTARSASYSAPTSNRHTWSTRRHSGPTPTAVSCTSRWRPPC